MMFLGRTSLVLIALVLAMAAREGASAPLTPLTGADDGTTFEQRQQFADHQAARQACIEAQEACYSLGLSQLQVGVSQCPSG